MGYDFLVGFNALHVDAVLLLSNDDSSPEAIKEYFGISKKAFKRAMGRLLKEGKVEKTEEKKSSKKNWLV